MIPGFVKRFLRDYWEVMTLSGYELGYADGYRARQAEGAAVEPVSISEQEIQAAIKDSVDWV